MKIEDEVKKIKCILKLPNETILKDDGIKDFLKEIGPDLNIVSYAFNYKVNGVPNQSLSKANDFNLAIFDRLKPRYKQDIHRYNLLVSQSSLSKNLYGTLFLKDFMKRLEVKNDTSEENYSLNLIRSVVMSPWVTDTEEGSALDMIIDELRKAVNDTYEEMKRKGF